MYYCRLRTLLERVRVVVLEPTRYVRRYYYIELLDVD
jgi:hypothetical protein